MNQLRDNTQEAAWDLDDHAARISTVVPTWRRSVWLEACLGALSAQVLYPTEVLVVGREQDIDARRLSNVWAGNVPFQLRWLEVDRAGHIAPILRGLSDARGDVVTFLDDDCEPEPTWLSELVKHFADLSIACVGGRVITQGFTGRVRRNAGSIRWYGQHVGNVAALDREGPQEVAAVMEGNWAWRTKILRSLHFDSVLDCDDASMYGLDLCLQAQKLGYKVVYESRARVLHGAAPRDRVLNREDRLSRSLSYARNYTYIGLKHFHGWRRVAFRIWWWVIGERGAYATVTAVVDILLQRTDVRVRWKVAMRGRREGAMLWRAR